MNQIVPTASSSIGLWVWLFPLAYGLHIAEEYWLHFPDWVSHLSQAFVSNTQFLVLNGVFWFLMIVTVVAIRARTSLAWLIATLATILVINAALHLLGSLVTRTFSPGSITAAFLYLPLALYAFRQILPWIARDIAVRAVGLGAAIHVGVLFLVAYPGYGVMTSDNTLERTVEHRGRAVLAKDGVLGDAEEAAVPGRSPKR